MVIGTETVVFQERQRQVALIGSTHEALEVRRLSVASGRFLPALEWDRSSPVAVLGQTAARELFPGRDPVGEIVRVGDWRMRVIGVLAPARPADGRRHGRRGDRARGHRHEDAEPPLASSACCSRSAPTPTSTGRRSASSA